MTKLNKSLLGGTALGLALGAGVVFYQEQQKHKHPLDTPAQRRINRALDRALQIARQEQCLPLDENSRYVIFSDLHKGAGDEADDFKVCKVTYQKALDYYYDNGFTLVLLGDVEELWENQIQEVMDTHQDVFRSEGRFYRDRYIRVVGNHDDAWNDPAAVAAYLEPLYPGIQILNGVVFEYEDEALFGELLLVHGHQGTLDSDVLASFSPHLLPVYRQLQNKFHIGRTTPATNEYLRGEHDTQMYHWASKQKNLILIAGHTHRPVWSSLTHLDQLIMQLYGLVARQKEIGKAKYKQQYQSLVRDIAKRKMKYPPVNDTLKTAPYYFNSGCCRFLDGDITGIEINGKNISLVKWDRGTLQRMETVSMPLAELFALL
jgi:UDP-2,3-diacylglucosamine pyrophosphatase LpxH